MDMMRLRREAMLGVRRIPNDYLRVKQLQSSGSQYIDTGIKPKITTDISTTLQMVEVEPVLLLGYRLGPTSSTNRINFNISKDVWAYAFGNSSTYTYIAPDTEKHKIVINSNGFFIDDELINDTTGTDFDDTVDATMYLYATRQITSAYLPAKMKVFDFSIKESGTEVLHFIPCIRKSDSKPGMYDTVSKSFFANLGSGEFGYEMLDGTIVAPA